MRPSYGDFYIRDVYAVALMLIFSLVSISISYGQPTVIMQQDWEEGFGDWYADNGVWEVGIPTVGPDSVHSGQQCSGTVLGGNYATYANTRLISPEINLPTISVDEKILVRFWHWYIMEDADDQGVVQVSVDYDDWQTISSVDFDGTNNTWSQYVADLSAYADSSVRIAFYFTTDNNYSYQGWYIDDVSIEKKVVTFPNPEDFESGMGDWSGDNGLWEVGNPTAGPDSAHSGQQCAGTVLAGNYPTYANTRLISPEIKLPPAGEEKFLLKFWHWYIMEDADDQGVVQVSVNSGEWRTISTTEFDGTNNAWSQYVADLSNYADSSIRIAFYFTTDNNYSYQGWYIDDIQIQGLSDPTGTGDEIDILPMEFSVEQNYPNPFHQTTRIPFYLSRTSKVSIEIFNSLGQAIIQVFDGIKPAGAHYVDFDGANLTNGFYYYSVRVSDKQQVKKMIITR